MQKSTTHNIYTDPCFVISICMLFNHAVQMHTVEEVSFLHMHVDL